MMSWFIFLISSGGERASIFLQALFHVQKLNIRLIIEGNLWDIPENEK